MNTLSRELAPHKAVGYGLKRQQFRQVAKCGFGDGNNSYPHAMAWFNGYLYVGTTRGVLALIYHKRPQDFTSWAVYPIKCPKELHKELDMRAQIWRYHPPSGAWEKVLTSPMITNSDGRQVCLFQGFRNMIVFQGKSDGVNCLYAHTWSPLQGAGHRLLRSENGVDFQSLEIVLPGKGRFKTHRALVSFKGKLFTSPSGKTESEGGSGVSIVLENDDPLRNAWRQVNEDNFGDLHNLTICEMAVFNNYLYAATTNFDGFQLWKSDCEGEPPYLWKKILARGAGRGPLNETVGCMCVFHDVLYVGTAIRNGGNDRTYDIGPAASELIRVYADDSWELVVGDSRISEEGPMVALSGFSAGFDNPLNTYFWRLCVHEGWLYLGTFNAFTFVSYPSRYNWSEDRIRLLDEDREREFMAKSGGFELWRTMDGTYWLPVTKNGFGNYYNYGIRSMASTPYGLFIGAANPFGPEVAVKRASGWVYEKNLHGGLEIWCGSSGLLQEEAKEKNISFAGKKNPVEHMLDQFYSGTQFRAFGYWTKDTPSASQACKNLMKELLSFLPEKRGKVLDLGCGGGATTEELLMYYPASALTGICFEKDEFQKAKKSAQGISFSQAIFSNIAREDGFFDVIINVESLSRNPRGISWMREAIRVLKPRGYLLFTEILSLSPNSPWVKKSAEGIIPITTINEFKEFLLAGGLKEIKVRDVTSFCWQALYKHFSSFALEKLMAHEIDEQISKEAESALYGHYTPVCAYVIGVGRKSC